MAYSDDAVKAKLNALNETQDSIVANAQWIMFHRRHADRTASQWLARLQEAPIPKRLVLIYLANEVVQQSRARGKHDFLLAFEPVIAEATSLAYKGASSDVQGKLRRVVEVWRQRAIFDKRILDVVDQRLDEVDKQRGSKIGAGGKLGGSLFGGGSNGAVPAELDSISKSQTALSRAEAKKGPAITTAQNEVTKFEDPTVAVPSPPVHAARLSGLMKSLASAQSAVEASIKARKDLISGLEKLLETNRAKLTDEEALHATLTSQKDNTEAKKREVEDSIMRGLSAPTSPDDSTPPTTHGGAPNETRSDKPEVEGFTPPPPEIEAFTPPPSNTLTGDAAPILGEDVPNEPNYASTTGAEAVHEQPLNFNEPRPSYVLPPAVAENSSATAANDFLNSLQLPTAGSASGEYANDDAARDDNDPRMKRRKTSHRSHDIDEDIFGGPGADTGVDEEGIAALLAQ